MRLYFENVADLADGIDILADDLGIEVTGREGADVVVAVAEADSAILTVTLDGKNAAITYGDGKSRFFRGLAILADWLYSGESKKNITETPTFKTNGAMVDMSRNDVMNIKTVKTMMRKMALMGLNMYMLYTEDTYEIEGRPYFGHMRGRYTKNELKELDAYALKLGIELIPCIQTLGHLGTHLKWSAASPYKDTSEVMLVGADATYELIDNMLITIRECFTSRRVHVGMDETKDVGLGEYLKKNGYREQEDIYFEHLARVIGMCRAHGLEPMMWSDMFFRLAGKVFPDFTDYDVRVEFTDEIRQKVPKGIQQVFWDYYRDSEEFYATNIDKHHDLFGKDTLFAGGIWTWSGYGPLFSRSIMYTVPALDACRKKGVSEIIATIWGNGGECNLILSLAGLAWYADYDYKGGFYLESVKECFARACRGVSYDDIMKTELCEHPDGSKLSLSRALVSNDPLIGLVDAHIKNFDVQGYYKSSSETLASHGELGIFAPAYDTVQKVTSLLENKADFGVRLKKAYDEKNTEALAAMAEECDVIIEKIKALRESHLASFMEYNKPFGQEIHDLHYGGLITRFETTKERINAYVSGEIDKIEELGEERLALIGDASRFNGRFLWMSYSSYISASKIY